MMQTACWTAFGKPHGNGYVRVVRDKQRALYHRAVWEEANGSLCEELELHHLCDNKRCYRPSHLIPVGTVAHHWLHRPTHCKRGHSMEDAYFAIIRSRGKTQRHCRPCTVVRRARPEYMEAHRKRNRKGMVAEEREVKP